MGNIYYASGPNPLLKKYAMSCCMYCLFLGFPGAFRFSTHISLPYLGFHKYIQVLDTGNTILHW